MQPQDQQDSSLFLNKLPCEIRLDIYSQVFCSTRLSFGRRVTKSTPASSPNAPRSPFKIVSVNIRPGPNSLSLLRVCRKVNDEIGDSWMGQVLFSFGGAHTMLEKLGALEPAVLSRVRHVRISGALPMVSFQSDTPTIEYGWVHVFKGLPGLCLDRLTVLSSLSPCARADLTTAEQLIRLGDGWKELCLISHNSAILELKKEFRYYGHRFSVPRLARLNSKLVRRDGPTASVSIYRSIHAAERGLMISNPSNREALFSRVTKSFKDYLVPYDAGADPHEEMKKEVLVVARRGRGVDCVAKPLSSDIRDVKVVQRRKRSNTSQGGIVVDTYKHVDDYE